PMLFVFFFSSRRRHTRLQGDWSSDVCSSDLVGEDGVHLLALELLDGQQVDAILTDLQMPVMDGLTLLGHLLERGAALPVAVMTGHRITPDLRERLQQYGIAATFTKPIDISFLADELQRSLSPAT